MNNAVNFFKSLLQAGVAVIVSVIFILISKFILRGYFYDTAYPVNMDYGEWADLFVSYVVTASVVIIILNILFVVFSSFVKGPFNKVSGWFFELILSIIIGVVFAVVFSNTAPEETSCQTIAELMFILEAALAFFFGSFFGDSYYKFQYNPILSFFNRRR